MFARPAWVADHMNQTRTITLEEHYATPGFLDGPGRTFVERAARAGGRMARIVEQLRDVDEKHGTGARISRPASG